MPPPSYSLTPCRAGPAPISSSLGILLCRCVSICSICYLTTEQPPTAPDRVSPEHGSMSPSFPEVKCDTAGHRACLIKKPCYTRMGGLTLGEVWLTSRGLQGVSMSKTEMPTTHLCNERLWAARTSERSRNESPASPICCSGGGLERGCSNPREGGSSAVAL